MSIGISYIAYSRVDKCKKTLDALCKSEGIEDYDIYIFSDAPHNEDAINKVHDVRFFLRKYIEDNKNIRLHLIERKKNLGSFENISRSLSEVAKHHEYVILVEEDVLVGKSFVKYMLECSEYFKDNDNIFAVTAYNPVPNLNIESDVFYSDRLCCYGLGMKAEDIASVEWNIEKIDFSKIDKKKIYTVARDISACYEDDVRGKRDFETSWDIILYYNMLIKEKKQVFPKYSFCTNIGFDGTGEWSSAGGFQNNNFNINRELDSMRLREYVLNKNEYKRFIKGFIQDNPKKIILRTGRRISSALGISQLARTIKDRYLR